MSLSPANPQKSRGAAATFAASAPFFGALILAETQALRIASEQHEPCPGKRFGVEKPPVELEAAVSAGRNTVLTSVRAAPVCFPRRRQSVPLRPPGQVTIAESVVDRPTELREQKEEVCILGRVAEYQPSEERL